MLGIVLTFILWLVSFLLIGVFAGSETALVRLDNLTVRHLVDQRVEGSLSIDRMLKDRQCLVGVLLIGTNVAVVLSTVLATVLLRDVSFGHLSGATVAAGSMVALILIFGELLPKRLAHNNAVVWSLKVAKPLERFYRTCRPLALLLLQIPRLLGRRMTDSGHNTVDEDSILTMVDLSEEGGGVLETERDMIVGVLESNHTQAKDVMTPRVDMEAVAADESMAEVLQTVAESGFSRIPVYEDTIDNIIGILYLKDLLQLWQGREQLTIREIMRPAYFVPQTKNASELLRELKRLHIHMAIVVDEYGGTAGLVTIEDLLEEIVGEIQDEYDWDEEAEVVELGDDTWLVDARLPIDEVSELIGEELPDDEVDTIGGLAYLESGRIPVTGEEIPLPQYGIHLTVAETDRHRITKLRIYKEKQQLQGA
jgi:putative hemolysin